MSIKMLPPAPVPENPNQSPAVAAVVLAAGMSRRMGQPKMLLPFGGKPLLARVLEGLFTGGVADCLVVTGHDLEAVERIVDGFTGARAVHNTLHATGGMLSSVQAGAAALSPGTDAFLVAPGDQPMLRSETVRALIRAWDESRAPVVLPVYDGRRGHPVLFSAPCARTILELPEGATLRDAIRHHKDSIFEVTVPDPATLHDIDTPEDYARALRAWESQTPDTTREVIHA